MHRYFIKLSYKGTGYSGWQSQPNAPSIQTTLEQVLISIFGKRLPIVGCGRTDAGVHAKNYAAHFDSDLPLEMDLVYKFNRMLPPDIVVHSVQEVVPTLHARFDAQSRSYAYVIKNYKDPFDEKGYYLYHQLHQLDGDLLQQSARLLLDFTAFFPFCKTHSDAKTMDCLITQSEWTLEDGTYTYHVRSNRFLRGMVRLIVGMCLNVATHKLSLEDVRKALDNQVRLDTSWSVPPEGLYFRGAVYPNE